MILQIFFLAVFAISGIALVVLAVYVKTMKKTNPFPHSQETHPLAEKFPEYFNKESADKLNLAEIWKEKIRNNEVEYKIFQGRGKPPIVIDGIGFEWIRDKKGEPTDFTLDKPITEYDKEGDPDAVPEKEEKPAETEKE